MRSEVTKAMKRIPIVDYLVLDEGPPSLRAHQCRECGARYFDRRNACASCGKTAFESTTISRDGVLRSFTIVYQAAPGVPTPFVAGVIDCDGTPVRANIINTEPSPAHIELGMKVRLATYSMGQRDGVEAIGFGFAPLSVTEDPGSPEAKKEISVE